MRKIQEVLRLRYALGLGQRQIARSCSIAQATVHEYLKRAQVAGVTWPLPESWDDARLEEALFRRPSLQRVYENQRFLPDFALLHQELQTHRHLTLQLWWEEYHQNHPGGYSYTRLCELYQRWRGKQDVVLRQEHKAGEKLFVDYGRRYDPHRLAPSSGPPCLSPCWGPATTPRRPRFLTGLRIAGHPCVGGTRMSGTTRRTS